MIDLNELLDECADALSVPTWDGKSRAVHLSFIEEFITRDTTPDIIRGLLNSAAAIFREQQKMDFMSLSKMTAGKELAALIQSKMDCSLPRFIYHGTIFGRLTDITKDGILLPGKVPVWKDQHVPRQFAGSAVFLTMAWRGAMLWAEAAHYRARGRREGLHRTPAVLRLAASGLAIEPDPVAKYPGCVMVKGPVPVKRAEVIVGRVQGFPKWKPLTDVLRPSRSKRHSGSLKDFSLHPKKL
jgi:hypothetical protein